MLTLYQFSTCPFCWKVKALLHYTKQPYQTVEVTPFSMKELDFTTHKKVPILKDGETVIVESAEIVEYINLHYSKLPSDDQDAEWSNWINEQARFLPILIHPNISTSFKHFAVTLEGVRMGTAKKLLVRTMGALAMPKVTKKIMHKYNITAPKAQFLEGIDHWVDNGLKGQPFHGGDKPSFIDCSFFGILHSSERLGVTQLAKQHNQTFANWYDACKPMMSQAI